jgi:hypothetical protein
MALVTVSAPKGERKDARVYEADSLGNGWTRRQPCTRGSPRCSTGIPTGRLMASGREMTGQHGPHPQLPSGLATARTGYRLRAHSAPVSLTCPSFHMVLPVCRSIARTDWVRSRRRSCCPLGGGTGDPVARSGRSARSDRVANDLLMRTTGPLALTWRQGRYRGRRLAERTVPARSCVLC